MSPALKIDKKEFPHGVCPFISQTNIAPVATSGNITQVDGQPALQIGTMLSLAPCVGKDCAVWYLESDCCGAYTNGVATDEILKGMLGSSKWHKYAKNADALMLLVVRTVYTRLNDLLLWKNLNTERNELIRAALMNLLREVESIRVFASCLPGEGLESMTMESFGTSDYKAVTDAINQVEKNVASLGGLHAGRGYVAP
jgi:hypothetical protein